MLKKPGIITVTLVVVCTSVVTAQGLIGNPKRGESVYQQNCLRCHGPKLDGNGEDGRYLIVAPANLRSMEVRLKSDWELLIAITNGVLFSPMHGWRNRLRDQEIMDVLAYIRTMAPAGTIS